MAKFKRNLITTALPYANGPVHIGHLAGVYLSVVRMSMECPLPSRLKKRE